jgi:hypothetical protein
VDDVRQVAARVSRRLGQVYCRLTTGHDWRLELQPTRLALVCWHCGARTPGWAIG